MPIYEYACQKCGKEFEVQQRITEDPLTEHEGCGGAVKRLISLTAFSLKGEGWYNDLYGLKKNGDKADGSKDKPAAKKNGTSESSSEKKSETKSSDQAGSKSDSKKTGSNEGKAA